MNQKRITDIHILKKKIVLYFNDEKLEINPNTFTEFNLYLNKLLSKSDIDKIIAFDAYTKDLNYALNLISKYAYTSSKLKKKLIAKKIKDTNINMIMQYLKEHQLIDDLGFALSYVDTLIRRHKGKNFIKERLRELGICENDIAKVVDHINPDIIFGTLVDYVKKLDQQYAKKDVIDKKNKIINNLLRNGYSLSEINQALTKVKLTSVNYESAIKKDYAKFKRLYDDKTKIMNALRRKGYSYSKIKGVMEDEL
ncbi:MAG: RecX family transcriptional regulator [Bacilli bacterium]|nr:RecX family transcriptional regulator [Bacilli bacterium]